MEHYGAFRAEVHARVRVHMSYDILLVLPRPGEEPAVAARRDQVVDAPLTEDAKARNARAVDALRKLNPALEVFESALGVELSAPGDGTGISVSLYADSGAVSVPYWHESHAPEVLASISQYLRVLHGATEFVAYDPQAERVVTPGSGFSLSQEAYAEGVSMLKRVIKKPWWKFW